MRACGHRVPVCHPAHAQLRSGPGPALQADRLHHYLEDVSPRGNVAIAATLEQFSQLGELYQVFDGNGIPIAQSQGLARHGVPPKPPEKLGYEIRYGSGGTEYFPLRLAWQKVTLNGQALILGVADPQRKYEGVLRGFTSILLLSTPFILLLATVCGLWLGRRALAPVARIADDARAIGESSLSARSAVPDSRDELQQLSETLNEMLDRIERSFTRTRQFTADASHELRAPMTLIDTAAQFSLRKERSREELVDSMRKILRESQRTTAVIDDLLTLARGDAGRETEGLVCFDAAPIVREVAQQASTIGTEKRVRVDLRLESETRPVAAHEPHLRRLLLILADNALKYTPAGGTVTMAGAMEDGAATITVADTGIGIAADDRPHVFERFWRADKVRSREAGGTGLGLAIARQIADRHHARLEARSEPGRGARSRSGCPPRSRQTAPEFITRPQLKLDLSRAVGARARVLEFGVGFEYWHNMFGKSADRVPGAKQFTPVFTVAAHLPLGAGVH